MEINSATATSLTQLLNTPQPPASAPKATGEPARAPQESAVVKLSEQAQQLSRAEMQNDAGRAETRNNVDAERSEARPQEKSEPPGVNLPGEEKRGRFNAVA